MSNPLTKLYEFVKSVYQREPVRINAYVVTLLAAVGVPVAVAGVPVATIVAIVLGGLLFTEGTRASVFSPANVTEIAADAADVLKPARAKTKRRA